VNPTFIPGLDLSELFYKQAVQPILARRFPNLTYSAALIGHGSEVLGFDTPQSMDHDWGPRLMLFFTAADHEAYHTAVDHALRQELPAIVHGYATNFGRHDDGTTVMAAGDAGAIHHRVNLLIAPDYFTEFLNFDPSGAIHAAEWVQVTAYHLLMLTAGRVFHDGLGQLEPLRAKLHYYPQDVWLYLLAAQWRRIGQEEAFIGRCGQVRDNLGSRLIAGRLIRDLMHLCFLMERQYAPYIKWLGSAFAQLDCARGLTPIFARVLAADAWEMRQTHLTRAYEVVARMHNALSLTDSLATTVAPFHKRPFLVIHADRFVEALRAAIKSAEVLALPKHLGAVDQFINSTDALQYLKRFRAVYKMDA